MNGYADGLPRRTGAQNEESLATARYGIVVFLVLATLTANAVSTLFVLDRFTFWESAVTLVTVLALAAGTIYTILWISRRES